MLLSNGLWHTEYQAVRDAMTVRSFAVMRWCLPQDLRVEQYSERRAARRAVRVRRGRTRLSYRSPDRIHLQHVFTREGPADEDQDQQMRTDEDSQGVLANTGLQRW